LGLYELSHNSLISNFLNILQKLTNISWIVIRRVYKSLKDTIYSSESLFWLALFLCMLIILFFPLCFALQVFMAAFPMFYKMPYKDKNLPAQNAMRQSEKRFLYECYKMKRSIFMCRSFQPWNKVNNALTKSNTRERNVPRCTLHDKVSLHKNVTRLCVSDNQRCYSKKENFSRVWCSAGSSSTEKQLRSLDSYFGKLQDNEKLRTFDSSHKVTQVYQTECQTRSETAIESLDEYLGKINHGKV